jgi:hypothetical protein
MQKLVKKSKDRKVSEVFLEYTGPFLTILFKSKEAQPTLEEMTMALRTPWCIWNSMVMKNHPDNTIDYLGWMDELLKDIPPEMKKLIELMKQRKIKQFGQYTYLIGEYKFFCDQSNKVRLRVEAKEPQL